MTNPLKIKNFSELNIKRRREFLLDSVADNDYAAYEEATNVAIESYRKKLKELIGVYDDLENQIAKSYAELGHYETEEQMYLIDKQLFYEDEVSQNRTYINSLHEMKIIYLSKSIELSINHLINYAYPNVDSKLFFRWESVKGFLDNKGIAVAKLTCYEAYVELRKVNNCIKHSSKVNGAVAKIPEFNDQRTLEFEQLDVFYNRIKAKAPLFIRTLKDEIKKDLYDFSDTRLNLLVKEFYERMDEKTYLKFIVKLQNILEEG